MYKNLFHKNIHIIYILILRIGNELILTNPYPHLSRDINYWP